MSSDRSSRTSIKARRTGKRAAVASEIERERVKLAAKELALRLKGQVLVNTANLRPTNSYSTPDFVERGFYVDKPFSCKSCGTEQLWTATQQRWWYEVAKGDVWTVAVLCKPCRLRERARVEAARKVHMEGLVSD